MHVREIGDQTDWNLFAHVESQAQRKSRDLTSLRFQLLRGPSEVRQAISANVDGRIVPQNERPLLPSDTAKKPRSLAQPPGIYNVPQGWHQASSTLQAWSLPGLSSPSRLRRPLAPPDLLPKCHLPLKQVTEELALACAENA